jgi:hypothetical protein
MYILKEQICKGYGWALDYSAVRDLTNFTITYIFFYQFQLVLKPLSCIESLQNKKTLHWNSQIQD